MDYLLFSPSGLSYVRRDNEPVRPRYICEWHSMMDMLQLTADSHIMCLAGGPGLLIVWVPAGISLSLGNLGRPTIGGAQHAL